MSSDLIALIVAVGLGVAVAVLGWRRDLGETTRRWLPRREEPSAEVTEAFGPPAAEWSRRPQPLSPRRRRLLAALYLLLSAVNLVPALLSADDDRVLHASMGVLFALAAGAMLLRKWPYSADGPST